MPSAKPRIASSARRIVSAEERSEAELHDVPERLYAVAPAVASTAIQSYLISTYALADLAVLAVTSALSARSTA